MSDEDITAEEVYDLVCDVERTAPRVPERQTDGTRRLGICPWYARIAIDRPKSEGGKRPRVATVVERSAAGADVRLDDASWRQATEEDEAVGDKCRDNRMILCSAVAIQISGIRRDETKNSWIYLEIAASGQRNRVLSSSLNPRKVRGLLPPQDAQESAMDAETDSSEDVPQLPSTRKSSPIRELDPLQEAVKLAKNSGDDARSSTMLVRGMMEEIVTIAVEGARGMERANIQGKLWERAQEDLADYDRQGFEKHSRTMDTVDRAVDGFAAIAARLVARDDLADMVRSFMVGLENIAKASNQRENK
jgi:hypothetical protein